MHLLTMAIYRQCADGVHGIGPSNYIGSMKKLGIACAMELDHE